jgi:glycosyltransferase involved in cell wall biosynthesis
VRVEPRKLRAVTLRVLHVDTERGWRGGERQTLWLARELARRGHASIVAARAGEPLSDRASGAGLPVIDCSPFSEIDGRAAWRLRRALRERRIDIVHAHTAHAVSISALATLGTTIPLVVSRRVDFPLRANAGTRWKYGRASMIIAISNAVARVLTSSGIAPDRVAVVPDGVDVNRSVTPASRETLASLGIPADAPLVVQVAQLVGHKDPLNFVRAIARVRELVPKAHALLVGDGPLRTEVAQEIGRLALESAVHLAGYRTDADALLASADAACLSSREEGMGSVLLDALAFGIPIAATRAGGISEVVVDGESGLLADVGDPTALGDAIARILLERELRERLRSNGRPRAEAFSVERMTDRTITVYEIVLASRDRRASTASANASSSSSVTGAP